MALASVPPAPPAPPPRPGWPGRTVTRVVRLQLELARPVEQLGNELDVHGAGARLASHAGVEDHAVTVALHALTSTTTQLTADVYADEANGSGGGVTTLVEQLSELSHAELAAILGVDDDEPPQAGAPTVSVAYVIVTTAPEPPHASPPPPSPPPYRSSGGSPDRPQYALIFGVPACLALGLAGGLWWGHHEEERRRRVACLSRTAPSGVAPTLQVGEVHAV